MKEMTVLPAHPAPVMAQAINRWQGVLQQWQYETDNRHPENGNLRHDYFVTAEIMNIGNHGTALFSHITKNDLQNYHDCM